ncbi:cytochrome P450 [Streptomyces flaveolus]|uniref:cytochrome P450 n=1 Tax=Streptomyces flaveolus TaxID=67297 RepID=UPI00341AEB77
MSDDGISTFNPLLGGGVIDTRIGLGAHRAAGAPLTPIGVPGVTYVSRHAHVREVLLDHTHLSSEGNFMLADADDEPTPALITQSDPPRHTMLRDLLRPAFRRASMINAAPWVQGNVDALLDALPDSGPADIVADIALPLTSSVITRLIGVPQQDAARLAELSFALGAMVPRNFFQTDEWDELEAYFVARAMKRRTAPDKPDDVLTRLVIASVDGEPLPDREIAFHAWQLFVAGIESTAYTIGWTVHHLLASRDRWEALLADRSLLPLAREEGLRHCTAIRWVMRLAKDGAEVGGVAVPPGQRLLVGLESANLDEAEFGTNAAEFDMFRGSARRHVAFGHGAHLCLGAELSRIEITTVLSRLLDRMPGLRLADPTVWHDDPSPIFCGLRRVDVVW